MPVSRDQDPVSPGQDHERTPVMGTRVLVGAFSTTDHTRINLDAGLIAAVRTQKIATAPMRIGSSAGQLRYTSIGRNACTRNRGALTMAYDQPRLQRHGLGRINVLTQLPHTEREYFDIISQTVVNSWSRRRIVLVGDAAWCATLFAGSAPPLGVAGARLRDLPLRFPCCSADCG
jgi:hypothetical protein